MAQTNEVCSAALPFLPAPPAKVDARINRKNVGSFRAAREYVRFVRNCKGSTARTRPIGVMPDSSLGISPMGCRSRRSGPESADRLTTRPRIYDGIEVRAKKCGAQPEPMAPFRDVVGDLARPAHMKNVVRGIWRGGHGLSGGSGAAAPDRGRQNDEARHRFTLCDAAVRIRVADPRPSAPARHCVGLGSRNTPFRSEPRA